MGKREDILAKIKKLEPVYKELEAQANQADWDVSRDIISDEKYLVIVAPFYRLRDDIVNFRLQYFEACENELPVWTCFSD